MRLLDYIYFRTFVWYNKMNDSNPKLMGELVVTVFVELLAFSILTLLTLFLFPMPKIEKWHSLILLILIYAFIKFRYRKVVDLNYLNELWGSENLTLRRKKGWIMLIAIFISMFFPVLIGFLRHNLGLKIGVQ